MDFLRDIFKYKNEDVVCGLSDELQILYYVNYYKEYDNNVLILTHNLFDANMIYQKIQTYINDVCLFPMDDFLSSVAVALSPDLKVKRLETLERLKKNQKTIIVTNLMGYLKYLPPKDEFKTYNIEIHKNDTINRDNFIEKLINIGYKETSLVTSTGEYAIRGYIIDIYPIESEHPIRIEFFGDDIDSIRYFNENTQLSINEIDKYTILPIDEINTDNHSSLVDYMNNPMTFIINETQITNAYDKILNDIKEYSESKHISFDTKFMYSLDEIKLVNYIKIETLNNIKGSNIYDSKPIIKFKGNYDNLKDFCEINCKDNILVICLSRENQIKKIKELIKDANIGSIKEKCVNILNKKINEGFIINKHIFISEYDIDDERVYTNYHNSYHIGKKIKDFNDLKVGDYVVHIQHGIGIYGGIVPVKYGDLIRDYILIKYDGNDKVYVPVEKITTIYKYSDADGTKPHIDKLNSTSWAKTKLRVSKKVHDISSELIKLYAERANTKGIPYHDYPEEEIFDSEFEYDATSDQNKSIKEIKKDLDSQIPMDRLLCGDVGFGKTEVAFRAMFKTVINGFQVAYLCPTTLLSRQQYNNAIDRFKEFAVNIEILNRYTTPKKVAEIINGLKNGTVDIVIGTHKLFNQKIQYKNLGLLVIDEEQRFGVEQKEKLKNIKKNVNVLTLSATPIPRTLKMAMSGLRDLSIIDTAPVNRYPVQTYVLEENEIIIKDAIYKELSRQGQVFILYNHVQSIEDYATKIRLLVPEAKLAVAHGQMDKNKIESIIEDFINEKYNILLCTTIIETGIDIPNVNTLIVIDADSFGLAQLYQLRGRVGRSNRIAYAYLTYKHSKILSDQAIKRLQSIKDFTELGSGYKIAMRDLSIRGAGDILGSEQAGFIDSVGVELYTEMINDEIKKMNGEEISEEDDSQPLIEVSNHISDQYVKDNDIKIEIHRMINTIKDKSTLDDVKNQIEDRFGKIDKSLEIYMYEEWFEKLADKLHIKNVKKTENTITIEIPEDISDKIEGDKLFLITYNINPKYRLKYVNRKIEIILPTVNIEKHFIYYEVNLLSEIINMIGSNK